MTKFHERNNSGRVGLNKLAADPRVLDVWRENNGPSRSKVDYWADLAPGYHFEDCTSLHEYTIEKMYDALDCVVERGDSWV